MFQGVPCLVGDPLGQISLGLEGNHHREPPKVRWSPLLVHLVVPLPMYHNPS